MKDGGSNHYFSNKEQNSDILLRFYFIGKLSLQIHYPSKASKTCCRNADQTFLQETETFKTAKLIFVLQQTFVKL
jgi:hypothetical protein